MARIIELHRHNPFSSMWVVEAPEVAREAQPGMFVALRIAGCEQREPLSIMAADAEQGTLTLVIATGGKHAEQRLHDFEQGDELDLAGPVTLEDVPAWGRHADVPARAPAFFQDSCGCDDPFHRH